MGQQRADVHEWVPGSWMQVAWIVVGTGLLILGFIGFGLAYAVTHGMEARISVGGGELLLTLLITVPLFVLHELIHGVAMRLFGGGPRYGVGALNCLLPYFYCTAPGHRFTRQQFLLISLAPCVFISTVGAFAVALTPFGEVLIPALAIHFAGCIGDLWGVGVTLRRPRGTLVEDIKVGMRFYPPSVVAPRTT